jgi:hypothetical protein
VAVDSPHTPDPSQPSSQPQPFLLGQLGGPPPKKSRRGLIIAAVVAGVLVVAAGTAAATVALTSHGDKPTIASSSTWKPLYPDGAPAGTPLPNTSAPSPTRAAQPATHKLGDQVTRIDGAAKLAVYAFKQPVATGAPRPQEAGYPAGYEWAAADVEVCAQADGIYVNRLPWRLAYADHTTLETSHTGYNGFPEPQYPWGDTDLPNGKCVRGWIVFAAPSDKRPTSIWHNPQQAGLTEWAIG